MGQPVLVGTVSIEKSEMLSEFLDKEGIRHEVLNARFHESEAHIVAQAGSLGAVTIATNMAGRGTDIKLGGNLDFRIDDELGDMEHGPERDAADRAHSPPRSRPSASRCSPPAGCSCSAPSATKAAASTTSCAAVRAARAIPACRASTSASTTICCASSARRPPSRG